MNNLKLLANVCSFAERVVIPSSDSPLTDALNFIPDLRKEDSTSLQLGSTLAQSFLDLALNPRTVRQYRGSYHRWETFCQTNNQTELPADPKHIAACLALTASET